MNLLFDKLDVWSLEGTFNKEYIKFLLILMNVTNRYMEIGRDD